MKRIPVVIISLLVIISGVMIPSSASARKKLEKLDSANVGPASTKNPLFGDVLTVPVMNPKWLKIDENLYMGPSERMYSFDPAKGTLERITDGSIVTGENTYDAKTNRKIRYNHKITDA